MRMHTFIAALLLLPAVALAQEQAFTNRATELKDRGANDAATVASLPENTEVEVLQRAGAWTRVDAGGKQRFVRVFHRRFPAVGEQSSSGGGFLSGLSSAIGGRQRSEKTTIATTGIRGLSPEDMKNAAPDSAALAKMQQNRSDKPGAERFAREGKLAAVSVNYVEEGSAPAEEQPRRRR